MPLVEGELGSSYRKRCNSLITRFRSDPQNKIPLPAPAQEPAFNGLLRVQPSAGRPNLPSGKVGMRKTHRTPYLSKLEPANAFL
jgi:hypothetical protein